LVFSCGRDSDYVVLVFRIKRKNNDEPVGCYATA